MLQYNMHPSESFSLVMCLPFFLCLSFKETLFSSNYTLVALAVWLLVWLAVEIYLQIKYKRHWPRYKKCEHPGHSLQD